MRGVSGGEQREPRPEVLGGLVEPFRVKPRIVRAFVDPGVFSGVSYQLVVAAAGLLGALVLLTFLSNAVLAWQLEPFDHSEGWNAYNAAAAMGGGPLYPSHSGLWFANYPPLSFFVVGSLGQLTGDYIVTGRALSLLSAIVAAFAIGTTARWMGCSKFESALAALLFLASPWVVAKFAGIDDPQMLGQALGCAGFATVIREPRRARSVVLGALLLTLALFVKPLFVDQPLALVIWLGIGERRTALLFAVAGVVFGLVGIAAADHFLHVDLLDHLLSARVYSFSRMFSHPGQWLLTGLVPLVATLYLFRHRHDRYAILCAIYAAVALAFSLFFCGGEGVGGNPTIDLSIATALGVAVFINRARAGMMPQYFDVRIERVVALASLSLLSIALAASAIVGWDSGATIRERLSERPAARRDIAYIVMHPGPALCETPSLCYWAHKSVQVDVWGYSQALKKRSRTESALIGLLNARYFRTVQLDRRSSLSYFADTRAAFARNYRTVYADAFGVFLVPQ